MDLNSQIPEFFFCRFLGCLRFCKPGIQLTFFPGVFLRIFPASGDLAFQVLYPLPVLLITLSCRVDLLV